MIPVVVLLALVSLLAPLLAAVPDGAPAWGFRIAPALGGIWNYPDWPALICLPTLIAVLVAVCRPDARKYLGPSRDNSMGGRAETAFAALLGIALLSLLARLVVERGIAYLGPMLRAWAVLATEFCLFALARRLRRAGRLSVYAVALTAVFASAVVADVGVNEYLQHRHDPTPWRVFSTSTPDFLAGYLIMLLPLTLALFVAVPLQRQRRPLIGSALAVLLLVVFAYQGMTLVRTQSRTALAALVVGLLVFLIALFRARRAGLGLEHSSWWRLGGIGFFILLIGFAFARPALSRLSHTSAGDNSTAFRLYTYRGSLRMAAANPVLGTGPGTYADLYPRYALTGFARLAHDSYLQMADECGLAGLLALLLALGFTLATLWHGLSRSPDGSGGGAEFLNAIAPPDDRVLLAGFLGSLSAAAVQNLLDSDWYVFFLGITFWTLAGLAAGLASPEPAVAPERLPMPRGVLATVGVAAVLLLVRMVMLGLAASNDMQATAAASSPSAETTPIAEQGWAEAAHWDPLNARYPSYLGYRVYFQRENDLAAAEAQLREAVRLEPSSLNDRSLATILLQQHRYPEAIQTLQDGLRVDPVSDTSFDIRLTLAQLLAQSQPSQSVGYYRQITELEDSPVGTVRAIGGIVPPQFAIADAGVADADFAGHNLDEARHYYARAARVLTTYADQGGTTNPMRQVLMGDRPDPALDAQMRDLYRHVMARRTALAPAADRPTLQAEAKTYAEKFAAVFAGASQPGML